MNDKRFKIGPDPDGEGAWVLYDTEQPTAIAYYLKIENALKDAQKLNEEYSTPRRTFEEIVKELAVRLTQYGWSLDAREAGFFRDGWGNFLTISKHDGFEIKIAADEPSVNWSFKSEELAAISAACSEIAENYQTDHGKENEQ